MSDTRIPRELRVFVSQRAESSCEYCLVQERYSSESLTLDHIIPRSLGGISTADNLALCCHGCNQHKATRTAALDPATGLAASLFDPRQQTWSEHFSWNHDFTLILGLTPTGRATLAALQLNRSGLVNLRRVLYEVGEHPRPAK